MSRATLWLGKLGYIRILSTRRKTMPRLGPLLFVGLKEEVRKRKGPLIKKHVPGSPVTCHW